MQEASSKFVDQIAVERLINDKLRKVHHRTAAPLDSIHVSLDDFQTLPALLEMQSVKSDGERKAFTFTSIVETEHRINNIARVDAFVLKEAHGDVIFVHGLYEDNMGIYQYFFQQLNAKGLNVYVLQLPFHYGRKPQTSLFSGELFLSADVATSVLAFKQAVYDAAMAYRWIKQRSRQLAIVVAFSMGGAVALSLASLQRLNGLFLINPVCTISELMWSSRLFSSIKDDIEAQAISFEKLKNLFSPFEPLNLRTMKTAPEKIIVANGIYDQINDPANCTSWRRRYPGVHERVYKAGHLNILRVPKLATDVAQLFNESDDDQ